MCGNTNELYEKIGLLEAERDRLREALGWFLEDERFHVAVGGNPIAVEDMLDRARAALSKEA